MAVCPNCGEENPDKAKFCLECATPLKTTPAPQAEERKVVSVLFVDLVGFTARSHDLDPEDVRAILAPYHRLLKTEIERLRGTVEKFIGDAVVGIFGAPKAHEYDAERAVRAAMRAVEAVGELNQSQPDLELSVRAAVNTGEGLVNLGARADMGEGIVMGEVINIASRLQGVAPVNGVVVGELTYHLTRDAISYEELVPAVVKGAPEPLPVWRAVAPRSLAVRAAQRYATPFVGREHDLAVLNASFERTLREPHLELVTIVGEPGVGKSRLVAEFSRSIEDRPQLVTWRQGRSLPYGEGIMFWALGEVIKAHAGIIESDSPGVASDKLLGAVDDVAADEEDRAWLHSRLSPLIGAGSEGGGAEQEESFTAWLRFLEALAAVRPLVIVLEDMHWADASLLNFIDYAVEWSAGAPILLLCTSRPELLERRPGWRLQRGASIIALSPLSDAETNELISSLLTATALPIELHAGIAERVRGNPLYAEEYVRMLAERAPPGRAPEPVASGEGHGELPGPGSLYAVIAARLDNLSPQDKSLLQDAAVVGKVFWSGAVAALGGLEEAVVRGRVQHLVKRQFIHHADAASIEAQQEYSFWHVLVRDVAYGQMPRLRRAHKHVDAARWLEGAVGERLIDHSEVLAHHYEEARALLSSSGMGERAAELHEPLIRFLLLAGDRAFDLDTGKALQHYERASELLSKHDAQRPHALLKLGRAALFHGELDKAIAHFTDARARFHATGGRKGEGRAVMSLWETLLFGNRSSKARRDLLDEAIALLEEAGPSSELAWAYQARAFSVLCLGAPRECLELARRAEAIAGQVDDARERLFARVWQATAHLELGDATALEALREARAVALRLGWTDIAGGIESWLAPWLALLEAPRSGREMLEHSRERAERRGLVAIAMATRGDSLWILYDLGEWDELLEMAGEIEDWGQGQGDEADVVKALIYAGLVWLWRGRTAEAHRLSAQVLPKARSIEDRETLVPALALGALVEERHGDLDAAVDLIEELYRATRSSQLWRSIDLPTALRILVHAGQMTKAERFARGPDLDIKRCRNCVVTGEAILAEARGDLERAANLYRGAAERWADYGYVLEEGQAHLGRARCLVGRGVHDAAVETLEEARALFARLGAVPLIEEADGYLQSVGARRGVEATHGGTESRG